MARDILSGHARALLDDMATDIVDVQQKLKSLPEELARLLVEQTQQLNAISAAHVQRLTQLSEAQRNAQAKAVAQGVELLNEIVSAANELIAGQSKKERKESFYQIKAVRDDALAALKEELSKVDGLVADMRKSLEPALLQYQQQLSVAAEATARYCTSTVAEADQRTATRMEKTASSVMQGVVGQMWTFAAVAAVASLGAGGFGAWAVAKMIAS